MWRSTIKEEDKMSEKKEKQQGIWQTARWKGMTIL